MRYSNKSEKQQGMGIWCPGGGFCPARQKQKAILKCKSLFLFREVDNLFIEFQVKPEFILLGDTVCHEGY